MPYNGSGVFSHNGADYPAVADTVIDATKRNNIDSDIATGLSTAITKDGQTTVTANLPMATYRHTGVGNGQARSDYAAMGQLQDSTPQWASTAGGTANALTLTVSPAITAYAAGQVFRFKSGASPNTGATTVAVSGLTTKAIQTGGAALLGNEIEASKWYGIIYDGAAFQLFALEIPMDIRSRAPTAIVNRWSGGGIAAMAINADINEEFGDAQATLSGALTAATYKEIVSVSDAGILEQAAIKAEDNTSRAIGLKVVIDGVTVFDAATAAGTIQDKGLWALSGGTTIHGTSGATATANRQDETMPFHSSLSIWVKSSLTETDKVSLYTKYRTV